MVDAPRRDGDGPSGKAPELDLASAGFADLSLWARRRRDEIAAAPDFGERALVLRAFDASLRLLSRRGG